MPTTKSKLKKRLEDWNLKRVPFPATPFVNPSSTDPLNNGSVFARELRQEELQRIRDDILGAGFIDGVKRWRWVWARKNLGVNVGMGKTALFTYVADQINHDYGKKFFGYATHWLCVYVLIPPKTKSVAEMATQALASIVNDTRGMSVERLLLARLRHKVIASGKMGHQEWSKRAIALKSYARDHWLLEHGVNPDALGTKVADLLRDYDVSSDVANAIAVGKFKQYLATLNEDNSNLFSPKPKLAKQAESLLLNDIARIAQAAGITHITFILDDFYHLVRKTLPADRMALASEFRAITVDGPYFSVNHNVFNWVAVMHTQTASKFADAWEHHGMHHIDALDYYAKDLFALNHLKPDQGSVLLEAYLNYQRPKKLQSKAFPYMPEALDMMARIAGEYSKSKDGNYEPRTLLQAAFEVTCKALLYDPDPAPIKPEFVEYVLKGTPLPEIVDSDDDLIPPSESQLPLAVICPCSCHDDEEITVRDVIALVGSSKEQDDKQDIVGYRCMACNIPIAI